MRERSKTEGIQDRKDYSFEDGVREVLRRIDEMYAVTDHDLAVGLISSGLPDVGKTTFFAKIENELRQRGIPVIRILNDRKPPGLKSQDASSMAAEKYGRRGFGVFLIKNAHVPQRKSREASLAELGSGVMRADIYVTLYRPGESFKDSLDNRLWVGDIIICNEKAKDKPETYRK